MRAWNRMKPSEKSCCGWKVELLFAVDLRYGLPTKKLCRRFALMGADRQMN
jgi:hypothetical protein